MCSSVEPAVVMSFLNTLYTQFDSLLHLHDVYKVETIGDCYMVAGGLVRRCADGVASLLEPGEFDPHHARKIMRMPNGQPLQVRVGIHSGPAMSGVVGTKMPRFCLFGDTINTASRCESTCPPSSIHATTAVRDLVPEEPWVATGGVMVRV
ncbi:guanylyl and adenylyl cyclase family member [Volvox carteri f. nagariensis]|uniref:Guanylyl and adenylyl cyclase family member n=1 Tax=Volvox carteri f. nagariensis TaxID=3068 RepID=D8UCH2_VOLCA|nr:guanylyl and adenylyl cyclase family member [Volvox carteri f. nagariensis]EFJ42492.1 guanylyl and adenylyl cyclase family member [Volvox carteri f. nagariensis]|eukprot:XP_002956348.1 guanylyl and adenylyl cyclase family member [Volvox carteri f. nagariensis]